MLNLTPIIALIGAPMLMSIINRTKAVFAGRKGPPLLQPYFDIIKLLRKGAVYSTTTTWIFRAGPVISLAAVLTALLLVPLGSAFPSPISFPGDIVAVAYLLGVMRFFTVIAAMDTGSSFEGMGASREVQFAALAEPAFLLGIVGLAKMTGEWSCTQIVAALLPSFWMRHGAPLILISASLFIVLLAENCRIPVDDPNTHLELTMIHEVMVLDHSGVDFGLIQYGAALKMWIFSALLASFLVPVRTGTVAVDALALLAGMVLVAVAIGTVESCMARFSMKRVPQFLVGALCLSLVGFLLYHA